MSKYVFTSVNGCGYTIFMEGIRYVHKVSEFEIAIHYIDGYILPLIFNDAAGENSAVAYLYGDIDIDVERIDYNNVKNVLMEKCNNVFKLISDALIGGE